MNINVFPRATEKAYGLSTTKNVYVFDVPLNANKDQIREAVESQYKVKVMNIKTLVQNGKVIRASRGKRAYPKVVTRRDMKKAYITLASGDSIKVFETTTENTPDSKNSTKEKK
ncbi:MAG: 50S ribosomal protein L23 [Candidatus Saccharimonadales bacterium]